jgi:ribosome maturation factor RimP
MDTSVSSASVSDRLFEQLAPLAERHGLELVATEVCGPHGSPIVRVYLDTQGGIDLDTITHANRWISEAIDADPPVGGPYILEVSSPGVERPLRRREDFARFQGERAAVKTLWPLEGRRRFTGLIAAVDDENVVLDLDDGMVGIPLDAIAKANLKPDMDFGDDGRTDDRGVET